MARIRTIKPEFPQSETIGRLPRDARLLFVQLWTICDDDGRCRAAARLLASLLYPYDDDAASLIDDWLAALESEGCIVRYEVDGTAYLQVVNWARHQKIDRPTPSKLPAPPEPSRALASPREPSIHTRESSMLDLGPRTRDQERERDARAREPDPPDLTGQPIPADWQPGESDRMHAELSGMTPAEIEREAGAFRDHYRARLGERRSDWSAQWRNWCRRRTEFAPRGPPPANATTTAGRPSARSHPHDRTPENSVAAAGRELLAELHAGSRRREGDAVGELLPPR